MTTATQTQPPPPRPAVMGPYRPDWMEKPSGEDMSKYYPAHAARHGISGKAKIVCNVMPEGRLSDCKVAAETPLGEHFGEAALKLSGKFRMIPPDDPAAAPATVTVPLVFDVPRPEPLTASGARALIGMGATIAVVAALLIATIIVLLGRYNHRAAVRSAEKRPTGKH